MTDEAPSESFTTIRVAESTHRSLRDLKFALREDSLDVVVRDLVRYVLEDGTTLDVSEDEREEVLNLLEARPTAEN